MCCSCLAQSCHCCSAVECVQLTAEKPTTDTNNWQTSAVLHQCCTVPIAISACVARCSQCFLLVYYTYICRLSLGHDVNTVLYIVCTKVTQCVAQLVLLLLAIYCIFACIFWAACILVTNFLCFDILASFSVVTAMFGQLFRCASYIAFACCWYIEWKWLEFVYN